MATSSRDWMFCPRSGDLLNLVPARGVAECPLCGFSRSLDDLRNVCVVTKADVEDLRRRHGLQPFLKKGSGEERRQRATVDEDCPKCGHHQLEYYTMQLRSADEGQTVFYECPKCKHKWSQNT